MRAQRQTARARDFVVRLDVVALGALVVVVMFGRSGLLGMKRRYLRHTGTSILNLDPLGACPTRLAPLPPSISTVAGTLKKECQISNRYEANPLFGAKASAR